MIEELDVIALKVDRPELGLKRGDRGTVVLTYGDAACEVEFVSADGETRAMDTFEVSDIEVVWRFADHKQAPQRVAG